MSAQTPSPPSPRIVRQTWGQVEVEGYAPFRDAKVYPGGAREWNWNETGTRHRPGIQPADVEELIERGARVVVLSTGVLGRLGVREDALETLRERGIEVYVKRTPEAIRLYNELRKQAPAAALIHSTC